MTKWMTKRYIIRIKRVSVFFFFSMIFRNFIRRSYLTTYLLYKTKKKKKYRYKTTENKIKFII